MRFYLVYLDESGYTGEDLLNPEQPIFVVASTTLMDDEAKSLVDACFSSVRAAELKHVTLAKRASGQDRVLKFIEQATKKPERFATMFVHKEFAVLTKMVDLWVESAMHEDGVDLYKHGGNLGLCNLAYLVLEPQMPKGAFRRMLELFQTMMREKTLGSYRKFMYHLRKAHRASAVDAQEVLSFFILSDARLGPNHLYSLPEHSLDLPAAISFVLVNHWRQQTDEALVLIHDDSSAMARERWIWDTMVSPDNPEVVVGYDRRKIIFPLNVTKTKFCDSKAHLQLQLADILAGATAAFCQGFLDPGAQSDYSIRLREAGIEDLAVNKIWPAPYVTPKEMGTDGPDSADALKFIGSLIRRAKSKGTKAPSAREFR